MAPPPTTACVSADRGGVTAGGAALIPSMSGEAMRPRGRSAGIVGERCQRSESESRRIATAAVAVPRKARLPACSEPMSSGVTAKGIPSSRPLP